MLDYNQELTSEEIMFIYSGKCRQGLCGEETNLKNIDGDALFVGDIVLLYTQDQFGYCSSGDLTSIVSDRYNSYSDGSITENKEYSFFAMGIKSCEFNNEYEEDSKDTQWYCKRVKLWSDIVDGENWKSFGCNYSEN